MKENHYECYPLMSKQTVKATNISNCNMQNSKFEKQLETKIFSLFTFHTQTDINYAKIIEATML